MATTYTPIATTTLGSNTASVTFSSISGSYTDLVFVCSADFVGTGDTFYMQFNGTGGTAYSSTYLTGDGTTATSTRRTSTNAVYDKGNPGTNTSNFNVYIFNIMNYSNTSTYKTILGRYNQANAQVVGAVSLWTNTSAINQVFIGATGGGNLFRAGSTFTLYGIKAA